MIRPSLSDPSLRPDDPRITRYPADPTATHACVNPEVTRASTTADHAADSNRPAPGANARHRRRLPRILAAACVALIAAAAAGPLRYPATIRFHVQGPFDRCRRTLIDFLWTREHSGRMEQGWRLVPDPEESVLEVRTSASDAQWARNQVDALATEFEERLAGSNEDVSAAYQETQRLLQRAVKNFENLVREARQTIVRAQQNLPSADPAAQRDAILVSILSQTRRFTELRNRERNLLATMDRLDTETPQPRVDPADADAAYRARENLQQDIEQCRVQLTMGRRHLEDVWQNASPKLDDLIAATSTLVRIGVGHAARSASPDCRERLDAFIDKVKLYQNRMNAFAGKWTRTFVGMRLASVDPRAPRLFAIQERLHALLSEFSFHAQRLMEDMRDRVRTLGAASGELPGNHQLVSQATRAFQRFETDHRQFEFHASDVYRRNNFELDSAVKSARGLHHRIQDTIAAIDRRLASEAAERARGDRHRQRADAKRELTVIREQVYAAIDRILEWQADLESSIPENERYFRAAWNTEIAQRRLADAEHSYEQWKGLLTAFNNDRAAHVAPRCAVTRSERFVDQTPSHLPRRVVIAAVAGIFTFATLTAFGRRRGNNP